MTSTTARSTVAALAAAVTWTITIPAGTVADATSTIVTRAAGVTSATAGSAGATISVAAGSSTAQVATIEVTPPEHSTDALRDVDPITPAVINAEV